MLGTKRSDDTLPPEYHAVGGRQPRFEWPRRPVRASSTDDDPNWHAVAFWARNKFDAVLRDRSYSAQLPNLGL